MNTQVKHLRNLEIALIQAAGAMKKRALHGSFAIVLVVAAPLAGRVVGTAWGAISAYQRAMAMFHNRRIALDITGQVVNATYRTYMYGK